MSESIIEDGAYVLLKLCHSEGLVYCPRIMSPRVTLIENFVTRKTVKEKLNDRRIVEPPMDKNSKKIRELTEAMHAERDIRIRNSMMAVLGVLKGHSTRIASDFADVDQRTVQPWVA